MKNFGLIFSMILVSMFTSAQIIHVPGEYATIQAAINAASDGDTVLVEEGTYIENINFRGKAITVASHFLLDRDTSHISKTVIDGSNPTHPDTASVVIMFSGEDSTSVLNGFTITGGTGTRVDTHGFGFQRTGGGVAIGFCGGKIVNNHITGNSLTATGIQASGGGISAVEQEGIKSVVIRNNRVSGNVITSNTYAQGGGIFTGSEGGITLVEKNEVKGNKATCTGTWKANAGGIMLGSTKPWEASLIVRDNLIIENEIHCVASQGGGIFLTFPSLGGGYQSGTAGIEIYNNVIANNFSEDRGGGIAIWDQVNGAYKIKHPSPLIYNNTIVGNTAIEGAGLFNFEMNALLFNNIIWNNTTNGAEEISLKDINYSGHLTNHGKFQSWFNNIQGGYPGIGNINQNPMFDPENFMIAEYSPCVGRGIDSVLVAGNWYHAPEFDFKGVDRLMASADGEIDLGALESPFDRPKTDYDSDHVINVPGEESSIQAAIDAAVDGDTVLVDEGYYYENINFNGKAITVASSYIVDNDETHIGQTIIDGSQPFHPDTASVVRMISGEDSTSVLNGFTITGGTGTKELTIFGYVRGGGGINIVNSGGKIENNIITGNHIKTEVYSASGGIGADPGETGSNIVIRNNLIFENSVESSNTFAQGGGMVAGSNIGMTLVENNVIHNNTATCTGTYKANAGGLMLFSMQPWNATLIVRNNIIRDNEVHCVASHGGGIFLTYPPFTQAYKDKKSGIEIYNNLITGNYCEEFGGGLSFWDQNSYGDKWLSPSPLIYNNTIVGNKSAKGAGIHNFDARILLFNNIIWNDLSSGATEIYNGDLPNYPLAYSKVNDGIVEAYYNIIGTPFEADDKVIEANNTYMDPLLDSGSSFKLQENSPAIGRGIDSLELKGTWYQAPRLDFLGKDRPGSIDPHVDPGAIESPFSRKMLSTANLASIDMAGTQLIPPFSSTKLKYILRMPENFDYVNGLIAIPEDALAEMEINHATDIFSENIDDRSTTITVTSSDGTTQKMYEVEFRPLSIDATLSALSVSQGSLDPGFDPGIFSYDVLLPTGTTEVPTISYVTSNEYATVKVVEAKDLTQSIAAYRTSRVEVTAQDGITEEIYKIVFRVAGVGIEDLDNADGLSLFPNPFSTSTTLEWEAERNVQRIDLLNMLGKVVWEEHKIDGNKITLNRDDLPSGLYFLKVYGNETFVIKLVIQ